MTNQQQPAAVNPIAGDFPEMVRLTNEFLFGEFWERPQLSKRDRSLITISVLTALYRHGQIAGHVNRGLNNGLTHDEIAEAITHVMLYAGWPAGVQAANIAKAVFEERGISNAK
jgi:4-carboxymuconolactone decarboxylase